MSKCVCRTYSDGLWSENVFWKLLGEDREDVYRALSKTACFNKVLEIKDVVSVLTEHLDAERLCDLLSDDYIENPETKQAIQVSLYCSSPDCVSVYGDDADERLARILTFLFPEKAFRCSFFADETKEYMSCTMMDGFSYDFSYGNEFEDFDNDEDGYERFSFLDVPVTEADRIHAENFLDIRNLPEEQDLPF